jgi:hypothetical protein
MTTATTNPVYTHLTPPTEGDTITLEDGRLQVSSTPIIPFIEGDGTGRDIWRASQLVFDAAVEKAYGGQRRIVWFEVLAGEKSFNEVNDWLPQDTLTAIKHHLVAIKGPLTTPVGGGFRSLNVTLRQKLDLFACVRPVRWFEGVYLRRDRVAGRDGPGPEGHRLPPGRAGSQHHPLPGHGLHRREADLRGRHEKAGKIRHPLRP